MSEERPPWIVEVDAQRARAEKAEADLAALQAHVDAVAERCEGEAVHPYVGAGAAAGFRTVAAWLRAFPEGDGQHG